MSGATALFEAVFEASLRASLLIVAIGGVLWLLRTRAGSIRHAAWTSVVIAMIAAPFVPQWLPALPMTLPKVEAVTGPAKASSPVSPVRPAPAPTATADSRTRVGAENAVRIDTKSVASAPREIVPPTTSSAAPTSWLPIVFAIWVAGVVLLLARLAAGWRYAARLVAGSRDLGGNLLESDLIATPLGVGIFRPRVIVPAAWTTWPDDMRRAVLLHERAHIRRRDSLIGLLASVGRCIHWFNPLAWWLERRIAATAEQACDDEVIRTTNDPARYAGLLVKVAEMVHQHGGRVAWQGVGMAGGGALGKRIDRVLSGAAGSATTPIHRGSVFVAAAIVIAFGVGCRTQQHVGAAIPERSDAELQKQLLREKGGTEFYSTAQHLTPAQVTELERAASKNPDDLDATRQLLIYYLRTGESVMGWDAMIAARRPHLLRMIERQPESDLAFWPLPRAKDPAGWDQARALWLKHTEKPDVTARLLSYAARFFAISEKDMAERLLVRAQAINAKTREEIAAGVKVDPRIRSANTAFPSAQQLGRLYALGIVGSDDGVPHGGVTSVSREEIHGLFAGTARAKLASTTDARVLFEAGEDLMFIAGGNPDGTIGDQRIALDFDPQTLGERYRARALQLDPSVANRSEHSPPYQNLNPDGQAGYDALVKQYGEKWPDATIESVALLSEHDQLGVLPALASRALARAETAAHYDHDPTKATLFADRARYLADWALQLAGKFKGDRRHAVTIFEAHMTRGAIAIWDGNRPLAVKHLIVEGLMPESVKGDTVYTMLRLTNNLLEAGERESVATFYEKVSTFRGLDGRFTLANAQKIRAGESPSNPRTALLLR